MNKPGRTYPRPLADLVHRCVGEAFARQGFAAAELVTHWADIVGDEIAAHAEPIRLQWPRGGDADDPQPATLVLRVEGPAAIEIQHLSPVILERVNRFLGWRAVGRLGLRQAPIARPVTRTRPPAPAPDQVAEAERKLPGIGDDGLRGALARLGAAINRT